MLGNPPLPNQVVASFGTVAGGYSNTAGSLATVGGGHNNQAGFTATVGGGYNNQAGSQATVGGGYNNQADDSATVGGGFGNHAPGFFATVSGGQNNTASGVNGSTIAGGLGNNVTGSFGSVSGGQNNRVQGPNATVAGGQNNYASGDSSIVAGGASNVATGVASFAAGTLVEALYPGEFVWADNQQFTFEPSILGSPTLGWANATNTFNVRATGGAWFVTGINGANGHPTIGVSLQPGGGAWNTTSDRNAKEDFRPIDSQAILVKVAELPIETWKYIGERDGVRHLGPVAQDFRAAFGLGYDDKTITTVDADGVALAAIQGLHQIVREKDARIVALEQSVAELQLLRAEVAALRAALAELASDKKRVAQRE